MSALVDVNNSFSLKRTLLLLAILAGVVSSAGAIATELGNTAPEVQLVGVFNTRNSNSQAIVIVKESERVISIGDVISSDWYLHDVDNNHILIANSDQFVRVPLSSGQPMELPAPSAGSQIASNQSGTVHTSETHSDLDAGQLREFSPMAEQSAGNERSETEDLLMEAVDHGMTRSFSHNSLAAIAENIPEAGDSGHSLEPGQSITFAEHTAESVSAPVSY